MKITRRQFKRIIKSALLESEKTNPRLGKIEDDIESEKEIENTDIGDSFFDAQTMRYGGGIPPRKSDADVHAVTDARKGSDRGQFPPMTFGPGVDDEGNLKQGEFTTIRDFRDPDDDDIAAVRRREKNPYNLGDREKSVYDLEHTVYSEDEKTEEAPYGTAASHEETDRLYRFDDNTVSDPGYTAHSGDDFYLGPEDEEGYEEPSDYPDEPDTEYGIEDKGIISRIKNYFSGKK